MQSRDEIALEVLKSLLSAPNVRPDNPTQESILRFRSVIAREAVAIADEFIAALKREPRT